MLRMAARAPAFFWLKSSRIFQMANALMATEAISTSLTIQTCIPNTLWNTASVAKIIGGLTSNVAA